MKKIVCLVLALAMVLTAAVALAEDVSMSASYDNGMLTVSTSTTGYFTISVDGASTARTLTPSANSLTFAYKLEDGPHTVTIESDMVGSASRSIYVGEKPADPTEAPATEAPATEAPATEAPATEAPATETPAQPTEIPTGPLSISASYKNGVVSFSVSGLKVPYGEIWLDGASTGVSATNGSGSVSKKLSVGTHTILVYTANESATASFEVVILQPTISASYQCGTLTYTVGGINNPSEIWLDGGATARSVSADGTYTQDIKLSVGSHTILVYDATNNLQASASFTVTNTDHVPQVVPGKAATCTETGLTDGEVCSVCGKVLKEQEEIPMIDHTPETVSGKEPTCTEAGLTDGEVCAVCGKELKAQEEIPALGHDYKVVDKANGKIFYRCSRCGDSYSVADPNYQAPVETKSTKNLYGSILKDLNNVYVDYTAEANGKTLVITADLSAKPTSEIGMYLDEALIAQIKGEGYEAIEYINGEADIVIELADINASWFDTNNAIWSYVFSTDPAAENGTLVKVEAQISGTDKVPATAYTGVTLKGEKEDVEITENGIY